MSSNITMWRTEKMDKLQIPLGAFYPYWIEIWRPEEKFINPNELTLTSCGSTEIHGQVIDAIFHIDKIEFSGTLIKSRMLKGDFLLDRFIVKDGQIRWKDIEI